jgi:hypothetical protein
MKKPNFEDILFDSDFIGWGVGNRILAPNLIGRYKFRGLTPEESEEELKKYNAAKDIYDKFINIGQKFKPAGDGANTDVECKITFIHSEKQTVTWRQTNNTSTYKSASGRWPINAMLGLVRLGSIIFI